MCKTAKQVRNSEVEEYSKSMQQENKMIRFRASSLCMQRCQPHPVYS
jgi:hypothetical protein